MTPLLTIILALFCHSDESRDLRFLAITQIPDQVRNDGTAVVILTKVRICLILNQVQNDANRDRHS